MLKRPKQPSEVFYEKGVLKNFAKFTEHPCLFFNKVAVNFVKFLRKPFLQSNSGWVLLKRGSWLRFCDLKYRSACLFQSKRRRTKRITISPKNLEINNNWNLKAHKEISRDNRKHVQNSNKDTSVTCLTCSKVHADTWEQQLERRSFAIFEQVKDVHWTHNWKSNSHFPKNSSSNFSWISESH